jgi:2-iminobutanoate/2-iminopropanoate deaminase
MKKSIHTLRAPAPIGPYSQAVSVGNFLFVSGQIAINPEDQEFTKGTIEEETHQVMKNIQAILQEAELNLDHIVNSTIYLKNFNDFAKVNSVYETYLKRPYPARTTIEVSRLPKDVNIEIAIIASLV